jgi:hypothetical protein
VDRREFIAGSLIGGGALLAGTGFAAAKIAHRDGYRQFDSDLPGLEPKVFAKNILATTPIRVIRASTKPARNFTMP